MSVLAIPQSKRENNIAALLKRHAEDAAFYWQQRSGKAYSPLLDFPRLTHLDRVLNAHLDGLRAGGQDGWNIVMADLQRFRGAGESFVASVLMLEGRDAQRCEALWQIIKQDQEGMLKGLISALAWIDEQHAQAWLRHWLSNPAFPALQWVALRGYSARRWQIPTSVAHLENFLTCPDAHLRQASARLVGRLRSVQYASQLHALLQDPADEVRSSAAFSLHLLGQNEHAIAPMMQGLLQLLDTAQKQRGLQRDLNFTKALLLTRHLGHALPLRHPALPQLAQQLAQKDASRYMLILLAHHGDISTIPWILQAMQQPNLSRVAAWALHMLTGLDIEAQGFSQAAPEEPDDAEYEKSRPISDDDAGLPWPNVLALQSWWHRQQGKYPQQEKCLLGFAANELAHCQHILQQGPQASRYAAAVTLAMQSLAFLETRQMALAQRRAMDALFTPY